MRDGRVIGIRWGHGGEAARARALRHGHQWVREEIWSIFVNSLPWEGHCIKIER